MNFLRKKVILSNAEFILLKLCIASAYVLIGAHFHNFFQTYYLPVFVIFGITVVWAVYLWVTQMKKDNQS